MEGITLPIDVVPNTSPPIFRWKQVVNTPNGRVIVDHEAALPPTVELAVERTITMVKQLLRDNAALQGMNEGMADRIAAQSEALSRKAEKPEKADTPTNVPAIPTVPTHTSRGKR